MSYRAGVGEGLRALGFTPGPPHVRCDGCGAVQLATRRDGLPYVWLMRGKGPPKWLLVEAGETRRDYCPGCRWRHES